jgi:hypothetical protein
VSNIPSASKRKRKRKRRIGSGISEPAEKRMKADDGEIKIKGVLASREKERLRKKRKAELMKQKKEGERRIMEAKITEGMRIKELQKWGKAKDQSGELF